VLQEEEEHRSQIFELFHPFTLSMEILSVFTCNYPTVLKEKNMEKQKEYNLRYLLAEVRTT
jgi:hypothetical protein